MINYRPISLLLVISKKFEEVIPKQLLDYFIINNLFSQAQHDFRSKHSTKHAVLQFHDYVINQLDKENPIW